MKTRSRLIRRGVRGGAFYCVDNNTGKRTSLRTGSEDEARQIVEAKNQAERQPVLNLQIAKAFLAGTDNGITTRTCQHDIDTLTGTKQGASPAPTPPLPPDVGGGHQPPSDDDVQSFCP